MEQKIQPLVSIIIVNYNGESYLLKCLNSIMSNNYKNFEIILVDNKSKDDSVKLARKNHPDVSIIELDKNYGFAKPNNIGAKKAKGDLLYFLNNDTIISKNSIEELVKVLQNLEIAICQSLLLHHDNSIDSSGDYINNLGIPYSSKENPLEMCYILSARGAAMMIKKSVFWELLGFDEKFFASFEDVDIGWRAWLWGHKVALVPKSIVYHTGGATVRNLSFEIKFHGVKNFLMLYLVNFERPFFSSLIKLAGMILTKKSVVPKHNKENSFQLPSFSIAFRGLLWILGNLGYVLNKRKKVNSKRVRSTQDLMKLGLIKQS